MIMEIDTDTIWNITDEDKRKELFYDIMCLVRTEESKQAHNRATESYIDLEIFGCYLWVVGTIFILLTAVIVILF